ncbi:MAG: sulfite exporter TauE/SafE family protein [Henriciella sp.]|nr:sulfite exporter TauE/SafE family protein [Henriciella sp.]
MADFLSQYGILILALVGCGLFSGLAAGLFGIGGGAIIVPVLMILFESLGFSETASHVAIATSLATIILTSARSVMAHNKLGAVDWYVVKTWAPWIMLGAIVGQLVAGGLSSVALKAFFGAMAFLLAAQLFFGRPSWKLADELPKGVGRAGLGGGIGILSALMGIGGGTFGVSLMTVCGKAIHKAVATAAGFGIAIGLPSAFTAIYTGWGQEGLPPFSLGYVNLAAFGLISIFTVTMAPVGAKLAHSLDAALLKRLFGILLAFVAVKMLWDVIGG